MADTQTSSGRGSGDKLSAGAAAVEKEIEIENHISAGDNDVVLVDVDSANGCCKEEETESVDHAAVAESESVAKKKTEYLVSPLARFLTRPRVTGASSVVSGSATTHLEISEGQGETESSKVAESRTPELEEKGISTTSWSPAPNSNFGSAKKRLAEERKRKAEAKEQERLEKIRKKEAEKEEKERLRLDKERQKKEQKEKERLEKQEQKERERLEKENQKQMEKEAKEKKELEKKQERDAKLKEKEQERQRKEEEKRAKEEEKKKKELEKQRVEDEKRRQLEKQQEALMKVVVVTPGSKRTVPRGKTLFKPFQTKEGMVLCDAVRRRLTGDERAALVGAVYSDHTACTVCRDHATCGSCNRSQLYFGEENRSRIPGWSHRTLKADHPDVVCLDDDNKSRMKAKLLQFHDQLRPAYYGTFRKRSKIVGPRRFLSKDEELRDYEGESGDEWEEEPEGDECESENEEQDGADAMEEEEENDGWMVPHGYLSDGEGEDEDESCSDPESRRNRLAAKAEAWKAEKLDRKFTKLVPVIIGPIMSHQPSQPGDEALIEKLDQFKMLFPWGTPVDTNFSRASDPLPSC